MARITRTKEQPPSRARYQAEHPTIGVHVDRDTYAKLVELRDRSGRSLGQLVRQALGVVEADVAQDELAYVSAYSEGQTDALAEYSLAAPCSVCEQPIVIQAGSEMAKVAVALLVERGWVHGGACAERRSGIRQT
jgi:hypothetical protein